MRLPSQSILALLFLLPVTPGFAFECANAGAAPLTLPDDNGDANATACGGSASAINASVAIGLAATTTGSNSSALGPYTSATGSLSLAVGYSASATATYGSALGGYSMALAERSTAVGAFAYANQPDTVILGPIAGLNGASAYANVGMGTSAPTQAVDVERSGAAARFQLTSFTAVAEEAPQYIQRRARGTRTAATAVQNGDNLGLFSFRGYNGTAMGGSRATITAQAAGNFTGASTPTRLIFATTPVGQTTPQQVLVITPDGKVQVNGVNLNVPDYVFEDDYELMPLEELRNFIDTHGHLPGIASADEVNDSGLDLAGSQMSQLQKIEELTLYTLQQQAELQALRGENVRLQARMNHIDQQLTLLTQARAGEAHLTAASP